MLNQRASICMMGLAIGMAGAPLVGQMPPGWTMEAPLGEGIPDGRLWWGAGLWAADKHGPPAPLVQSMGLGNSLVGSGLSLAAGAKLGAWDLAGRVLLYKNPDGESRASLLQAHALYRSRGGWLLGLEKESLTWGYGLNGGYLLGEAARPFPRLRVATPFPELSLFKVPLGAWKGQLFLGKLENHRRAAEATQDPSYRSRAIQERGEPQAPMLSGFRLEARFGDRIEAYANWINLFGGTLKGRGMTEGYGFKDYLTAFTGTKDAQAEADFDMDDPDQYENNWGRGSKVRSASNADIGVRLRLKTLAKVLGAEEAHFYLSRGSKAYNLNYKVASHRPLYYLGKDLQSMWPPARAWDRTYWYYAPAPQVPNDAIGLLVSWPAFRLGLEYLDTVNAAHQFDNRPVQDGHRSFAHYFYKAGFYYQGDPLGSGLGGEARYTTLRAEWDATPNLTLLTWLHQGQRPFRDAPEDWVLDHPGMTAVDTSFYGLQQGLRWQVDQRLRVRAGYSWQHQNGVEYVQGDAGNGFRWYLDLAWTWSR